MVMHSPRPGESTAPTPAFVWMAVGMLAILVLCAVVTAGLLVYQAPLVNK